MKGIAVMPNGETNSSLCKEMAVSEEYQDFISSIGEETGFMLDEPYRSCIQYISDRFRVVHVPNSENEILSLTFSGYQSIPNLFGLQDTASMDASGITRLRNQPYLNLRGRGVLVGIIDTGIDYTHPAFRYSNGSTRILAVWDQSIQTGTPPRGRVYGSEYREAEINEALASDDPYSIVPSRDEIGHGTFMAGIAAGSEDPVNDFTGAAPDAGIVVVKLKPAKRYLRDFYRIQEDAAAFQENDIMMGISVMMEWAFEFSMPIVICLGVGTNLGGHTGVSFLSLLLNGVATYFRTAVVAAGGNEGNANTHFRGTTASENEYETVELIVGEGSRGFSMEFWVQLPAAISLAIISPTGEVIPRNMARAGTSDVFHFIFESTVIYVDYIIPVGAYGENLIFVRFVDPTPGLWQLRVYGNNSTNSIYDIWLPIRAFVGEGTYFLKSDPYITLTEPSNNQQIITVSTYDHRNNSFYLNSGRGFTRTGVVKPDIAAPGVNVFGPAPNGGYELRSGSSIAAAHVAGAAALMLEWGVVRGNNPFMNSSNIKGYLIRGAVRETGIVYPSREWGYGRLDIYNTFLAMRISSAL